MSKRCPSRNLPYLKEKEKRNINSVYNKKKRITKINHQPEVHVQEVSKPKYAFKKAVPKRKRRKEC
jgi:hypothetical protein